MSHRVRSVLLAAGLLAPIAVVALPADAAPPALTVSVTAGAPGTAVTVTGTGCSSTDDADRSIEISFISGTAPNERLAGQTGSYDGDTYPFLVPTWIDPAQPAVIEARCVSYDYDSDSDDPVVLFSYDPVPFDVLPGGGPAQTATLSRTTAKAGQAIRVDVTDCAVDLDDEDSPFPSGILYAGSDLSGRTLGSQVGYAEPGFDEQGAGDAYLLLVGFDGTPIPQGTYTFVPGCTKADGQLGYEPQLVTVDGTTAYDSIALTTTKGSSTVTLSGAGCVDQPVDYVILALDTSELPDFPIIDELASGSGANARILHTTRHGLAAGPAARAARSGSTRAAEPVGDLPQVIQHPGTAVPAADGSWSASWDTGIHEGAVLAYATCGDPVGDGFSYDVVEGTIEPAEATTPTTVVPAPTTPATAPAAPAPATAVPGRPTYAG
ncbi:hypothetical protein KSP35_22755 [Aquihabitans sp. G128]|uniref:hypothetical protein n=1 Tax=Aquihabitans sp. G128 TaxID=2849779 RepID=UPI001C2256F4|nr:hypothetical protein [Aquihabitans sp. G128]QXC61098.1 hypothetical protein KSP35_22755 [Aquihabitans sp. G128]